MLWIDADVRVDDAAVLSDLAPDDGSVLFDGRALLELFAQPAMHLVVFGDDDDAAGVLVEPMHDPRPKLPRDVAELVEMKLQRSGQRAAIMPLAGVRDHVRRLVEHDEMLVLKQDVDRDVFRRQTAVGQFRQSHVEHVVDSQSPCGFDGETVQNDGLLLERR